MRLDLFSLKLFVDIVEERSIGKGAAKNCIAMSAASKRMSDLEQRLGAPLLLRQSRGVVTTGAGETLYKGMTETLSRLARVAAAVGDHAQADTDRPVRLLASATSLAGPLPDALKSFVATHGHVAVELDEQAPAAALQALSRGDADLAVVAPVGAYPANVLAHRYAVLPHVVVAPLGHAIADGEPVTFDRVARHDLVALEHEAGWDPLLRRGGDERDRTWRVRARLASFDGVLRLVAAGLGIAVVPQDLAVRHAEAQGLCVLDLDEPWAQLPLDVCVRDGATLSPGARALFDHLRRRVPVDAVRPPRAPLFARTRPPGDRSAFTDSAFSH